MADEGAGRMLDWDALVDRAIAVRKAEKISQREVAVLAGVTAPTVIKFEQKRTSIRVESALAILTVLGLAGRRTPTREIVDELAALHAEGEREIRGRRVVSDEECADLEVHDRDWQRRVRMVLRRGFPHSELVLFTRLGALPDGDPAGAHDARHAEVLRSYSAREDRLKDILRRYSDRDPEAPSES